jgi:hypothetical protein
MRLALVRSAFFIVSVQAKHIEQGVAAFRQCHADCNQVERSCAH